MSKKKLKIMSVFGTRPEAIKMAPVVLAIEKAKQLRSIVVVTGQHRQMLDQVLKIFKIKPDYDLNIMAKKQTLSHIVIKSLQGLEKVILQEKPDMIVVQGDTSTTFVASLAAYYYKIPVAYVEAGLRTYDKFRPYPEEMNRKLTTALADLYFPPTGRSKKVLLKEGIKLQDIYLTGNTVIDALKTVVERKYSLARAGINLQHDKKLILLTAHRRENWGKPLRAICQALKQLSKEFQDEVEIVFPMHKNPIVRDTVNGLLGRLDNVQLIEPLDYEPFVHLMAAANIILTDSGGVQEEAPSLGKPVLVLREKTERPEAIAAGAVKLVGVAKEKIYREAKRLLTNKKAYNKMAKAINPYGDGLASARIVQAILKYFGRHSQDVKEFKSA